jgi:hypothetical protein
MASEAKLLVVQFLRWLDERPRTQADVQSAWQSTCQRFIVLTRKGLAALQSAAPSGMPRARALP